MDNSKYIQLRKDLNTLANFLFCSNNTNIHNWLFEFYSPYVEEHLLFPDDKLLFFAGKIIEEHDNWGDNDCHNYIWDIYYRSISDIYIIYAEEVNSGKKKNI